MRVRQACHPKYPDVVCRSRWEAQIDGEFFYSVQARGWLMGKNRKAGPPPHFRWESCPYCGYELPSLHVAIRQALLPESYWKRNGEGEE